MRIHSPLMTNSNVTGSFTGSFTGSYSGDGSGLTGLESSSFATTASYVEYSNVANKPTLISGSAQIAADISGSFTAPSSSLSLRVTNLEVTASSLTTDSGSFSTRVTDTEASASSLTTDSGSFSTRVTDLEAFSSSLDTNYATDEQLNTATSSLSASIASTYLLNTTDTFTGDLTVTGKITAQEFHTEFVSSSIVFSSGSTKFGDSFDDTHSFTGSVNLTGSLYINGSEVGTGKLNETVFNAYTSSTDSRLDIAEGSITSLNAASSSYALEANISGSFTSLSQSVASDIAGLVVDSGSFSTRVTSLESFSSSLDATYATDAQVGSATSSLSASLAVDIASLVSDSGSFSTRVTSLEVFSSSLDTTYATDAELNAATSSLSASIASTYLLNTTDTLTGNLEVTGNVTGSNLLNSNKITTSKLNVYNRADFDDNVKAYFGDQADLSIYHDGSNSYIAEGGVGALNLLSNLINFKSFTTDTTMATFDEDGAVSLSYSGSTKLQTTANGVTITGTLIADGTTLSSANISGSFTSTSASFSSDITSLSSSLASRVTSNDADILVLQNFSSSVDTALSFSGNNVTVAGDLTVAGTASINYLQSVTGEAKIIGDNYIILNADTPSQRYSGIKVYDSGSAGETGSLEYDSISNHWFYESNNEGYASILMAGPKGTRGSLTTPTSGSLVVAAGNHLNSSNITDLNGKVSIDANTVVTGSLTTSGNVGIGTASPGSTLHVNSGTTNIVAQFESTDGTGGIMLKDSSGNVELTTSGTHGFNIQPNGGSTVFRVNSNSNVGIGHDNPTAKLDIKPSSGDADLTLRTATQTLRLDQNSIRTTTSNDLTLFTSGNTAQFVLDSGGGVGIGTNSPTGKFNSYISATRQLTHNGNGGDLSIISDNNSTPVMYIKGTGTADLFNVYDNTTEVFSIADGGNVTITGTVSGTGFASTTSVNGTGDSGLGIVSGGRLGFDESGTRSWTVKAAGGNLAFASGDGNGSLTFNSNRLLTVADEGTGNGLDADTVDSLEASQFLRSDASDTYNSGNAAISLTYQVDDGAAIASAGSTTRFPIQIFANNGTDAAITFHISGDYAAYFGLDAANNDLSWGGWSAGSSTKYRVLHTGNYSAWNRDDRYYTESESDSRFVNVTGDSMTGALTIATTGTANSPSLAIDNSSSSTFNHSIEVFAANLAAGETNLIAVGKAGSTKNTGYIGYKYSAAGSNANILSLGHWGSDHLVNLTGDGKFGIGTESPQKPLEVITSASDFASVGVAQLSVGQWTGIHFGYRENNNSYRKSAIVFERTDLTAADAQGKIHILNGPQGSSGNATLSDAKLTIAENGNVGIGETSPSAKLEVYNSGSTVFAVNGSQGQLFSVEDDLTGTIFTVADISGVPILEVEDTGVVTIDDTLHVYGDITAYYSSDERLKDNIVVIENANDKVLQLRGVEFDWNENSKHEGHDVGVIAQDVEKVLPELVKNRKDGYKAVDYEKIVALLIESNKELINKNTELQSRIEKLESKLG